jgi:hypothetical protein
MLYNLPTTKAEANNLSCGTIINTYATLTNQQKQKWLRAASKNNGCIRIALPQHDASTIQVNVWDSGSQSYSRCSWIDKDPFDV